MSDFAASLSWRQEYSWTSKTVHWLLPWRVPAFDKNVRNYLRVPKGWDNKRAYGEVARRIFALARQESPEPAWAGPLQPCTPLRALDKWLWWDGDGKDSHVYVDPDPWRVVRELNLSTNDPVTELSGITQVRNVAEDLPQGSGCPALFHPELTRQAWMATAVPCPCQDGRKTAVSQPSLTGTANGLRSAHVQVDPLRETT
jgi:hypothetical protein